MRFTAILFILLAPTVQAGHGGPWHEPQAQTQQTQQTPLGSGRISEPAMQREYERQLQREREQQHDYQQQIERQREAERGR